jgi:hypothetical protein
MAIVIVMGALVGAGVWIAIRLERGLDTAAPRVRATVRTRNCALAERRTQAARTYPAPSCRNRRRSCQVSAHRARAVRKVPETTPAAAKNAVMRISPSR